MKINDTTEVMVDKLAIRRNVMTLGVIVKNSSGNLHDVEVKLAVKFVCENETRIMPLSVNSVMFDEMGRYVGYANFNYELDVVFFRSNMNDFSVVVQIYDGAAFRDVYVDNPEFNQVKDENEYVCKLQEGVIRISRKRPVHSIGNNPIIKLICLLYRLIEFIIGTLMFPLFIMDGIYLYVFEKRRRILEDMYGGSQLKRILLFAKWKYASFIRVDVDRVTLKVTFVNIVYALLCLFFKKDSVLFVSTRRTDLTGNIAYVNNILKNEDVNIRFWLVPMKTKYMRYRDLCKLAYQLSRSKVVVIDDFTPILNRVTAMKKKILIQLWHACGAFKTFGFSRLGKDGGPYQVEDNHRHYNYAIVSSNEIRRFYAEGFGIDEKNVLPLGMPRTDDFFDEEYKCNIRKRLYDLYPQLKNKKVVLFAPTFRGNGAESAFYPFKKFNVKEILDKLNDDYMLIIKHHPFIEDIHPVEDSLKDRVIDLSAESEINDLLFITDLLITDYSSVIFEASLLNIPMLFYAFDMEDYVVNRDFYYPYRNFVPGKIVRDEEHIIDSILNNDFEQYKVEEFKKRSFDYLDGKSSERVAEFILSLMK